MPPEEAVIIIDYFNEQKSHVSHLLKTINEDNFENHLAYIIGIDRKLQLLISFLNPRDFHIVDDEAIKLINLVEDDYKTYHYEQFPKEIYPLFENSIIYHIK